MKLSLRRNKNNKQLARPQLKKKPAIVPRATFRQRRLKMILERFKLPKINASLVLVALGVVLVLSVFYLVINAIRSTDVFKVKSIELYMDQKDQVNDVSTFLDQYKGNNVFKINLSDIKNALMQKFPSIRDVYFLKGINGVLKVEVVQDLPNYYYINNSGIYLVNQNGKIIDTIKNPPLTLTDLEKKLESGQIDSNAEEVRIAYLATMDDPAQRQAVVWKDVSADDKQKTLDKMKGDADSKVSTYFSTAIALVKQSKYPDLIGFYDNTDDTHNVNDYLDDSKFNFLSSIVDFFKNNKMVVATAQWTSPYTLQINLDIGKEVLFSLKRDLNDQFQDLKSLMFYNRFYDGRIIDVRSVNNAVIN